MNPIVFILDLGFLLLVVAIFAYELLKTDYEYENRWKHFFWIVVLGFASFIYALQFAHDLHLL